MNRITYCIFVTWREGEASIIQSLNEDDFEAMRRGMIDEGFSNLLTEWYEPGSMQLPDRILVFVYWEAPDSAPDYDLVRKWGNKMIKQNDV